MKKSLKIWLIAWASLLVAWWSRIWLTKAGVIPNRFNIEILWLKNENNKKANETHNVENWITDVESSCSYECRRSLNWWEFCGTFCSK